MAIEEHPEHTRGCRIGIDATDVSTSILDKAQSGEFNQFEIQNGLPVEMLLKYFDPIDKRNWIVKPKIRKMVRFDYFNLLRDMDDLPEYDVIFCRNVLSLFEHKTQAAIIDNMLDLLPEDGFVFLGKDENIKNITDELVAVDGHSGLYILRDGNYKFTGK